MFLYDKLRDRFIGKLEETIEKKLRQQTEILQKNIESTVKEYCCPPPVYWSDEFERSIVKANWGNVTEKNDFAEKFLRLIRGLDDKSIEKIVYILIRQKQYLHSDKKRLDLFTRAEQEEIRLLREYFYPQILKLSDSLFAYKHYLLPIHHFEPSVFYYKHGLSELETLERVKGKAVLDVGGFVGDSVLILSELSPGHIYTFEAVPENFELLKKTVALNHIPNVTPENVALGEKEGNLQIHVYSSASTSIERPGINYKEDITVPVIPLDKYVKDHNIDDIGLIKVDIEGGEPAFLKGAKETICTQKPILLLSIYHNAHDFFELKPLLESWNLGYTFKIHKPVIGNATSETLLLAEINP